MSAWMESTMERRLREWHAKIEMILDGVVRSNADSKLMDKLMEDL